MNANTFVPSYKLVKNNTSTAAKAPYYGMLIPLGSVAYADILSGMVAGGTFMTEATAEFLLDAFYEYCREAIAEKVVRISTGTVSVYPMISGSFDSEDAAFDPTRNALYVGASFSQDLRSAVSEIVPRYGGEETANGVHLDSEMDIASQCFKVVDGTANFRLAGRNLTVPDGADESIALYAKDGLAKVSDIVVSENDGGQRLTCRLKGDVAVPKGQYKIVVTTHGLDPTAPLSTLALNVTNVTAYAPATPRVTDFHTAGKSHEVVKTSPMLIEGDALGSFDKTAENALVVEYENDAGPTSETVAAEDITSVSATSIVTSFGFPLDAKAGTIATVKLKMPGGTTLTAKATVLAG